MICRASQHFAIEGKSRAMAGAIPCLLDIIPCNGTFHMSAQRIDGMELAVFILVQCNFFSIVSYHFGLARRQLRKLLQFFLIEPRADKFLQYINVVLEKSCKSCYRLDTIGIKQFYIRAFTFKDHSS